MAFTLPESDLDSSMDHLIPSPWEGTSRYSSLPETNQGLYPAWLPLLQIPDIFSNQDISLSTLTHHHHHQGMVGFLIGGSHFSSESSTISVSSNKFFEGLWQKKKMAIPNPYPPHPPPPRYGRFLKRWFKFFLREGLWQKHTALASSHLNEGSPHGCR